MNTDPKRLFEQALTALQGADPAQALPYAQALCKIDPEHYEYRQMAGVAALSDQNTREAREHFRVAIRVAGAPYFAGAAWSGIGQTELSDDDPDKAEAAFRRALSLIHEFPPALAGLAETFDRQRRYAEAQATAQRALELGHDEPRLHLTLGHACLWQDKFEEAEKEFHTTLSMKPDAYAARFGLGLVAKSRGQLDEAHKTIREVLDGFPDYAGYSQFAALHRFEKGDEFMRRLEERYADLTKATPTNFRIDLMFAMGKAYDDVGDIEQASRCLHEGNRLQATISAYDPEPMEEFMRRLEKLFTREFVERFEGCGLAELSPIFIVSMPRSGSTLIEQMLATHSKIRGGGELKHFNQIAYALGRQWGAREDFPNVDTTVAAQDLRAAGREYAKHTAALRLLNPHFTDKALTNFYYIGMIRMMLPDAHVVHIRRHPLATALGIYRQRFGGNIKYGFNLEHIVGYYRAYARLMRHWRAALPEAFTEVFYEALVADPERELRRVLDYLGLEFEPACLDYHKLDRPISTASVVQVREPLNRLGLERHKQYGRLLAPVAEGLAEEIAAYERDLSAALDGTANTTQS